MVVALGEHDVAVKDEARLSRLDFGLPEGLAGVNVGKFKIDPRERENEESPMVAPEQFIKVILLLNSLSKNELLMNILSKIKEVNLPSLLREQLVEIL